MSIRPMLAALVLLVLTANAQADRVEYLHTDILGNVVAVTDENANVIERRVYEPYGLPQTPVADGPGFTGHDMDGETGLVYMQQRYYDPLVGQFLSVDPMAVDTANAFNFNRYNYAANNPYRYTDPDGQAIDTVVDIGFLLYDAGNFIGASIAAAEGKLTGNGTLTAIATDGMVSTGIDTLASASAFVTPGVPASVTRAAARSGKDSASAVLGKRGVCSSCGEKTSASEAAISQAHGMTRREAGDAIHHAKEALPRSASRQNPDVEVCQSCGEIFPQTADDGLGDSIGNIKDER